MISLGRRWVLWRMVVVRVTQRSVLDFLEGTDNTSIVIKFEVRLVSGMVDQDGRG